MRRTLIYILWNRNGIELRKIETAISIAVFMNIMSVFEIGYTFYTRI